MDIQETVDIDGSYSGRFCLYFFYINLYCLNSVTNINFTDKIQKYKGTMKEVLLKLLLNSFISLPPYLYS